MIKIILMIIALSCAKNVNELKSINKGINEDLIKYCKEGNKEKVIELLNNKADVNFKDEYGNTALFYAAKQADEENIKILIERGADINIRNSDDIDPLLYCFFYSSSNNKVRIMKKLIEYGANVNSEYSKWHNLLVNAVGRKEIKVIKLLLESGVSINAKSKIGDCTALMEAIKNGYLRIIDILLKAGAECSSEEKEKIEHLTKERNDINFVNENGETALLLAVANEELELTKSLIEKGANLNVKDRFNYSPFAKAVLYTGNKKMIKLFLDNGANINEKMEYDNKTPLLVALDRGNSKLAEFLIECGASVEEKSQDGKTALTYAAKNNCIEIAKMLVEIKSNTSDFSEALNCAALFGHLEIIKLLWEKAADLKECRERVLLEASFRGYTDIARWLIERGVDINIEFSIGDYTDYRYHSTTPLIAAAQRSATIKTAKLFIEKGADINKKDSINFTPLMSAAKNGNLELVKLFLKLDVDVNIEDNNGETALSYAVKNNHKEIEKLISERNIYVNENVNAKNTKGVTLLMQAAIIGDKETIDLLISKGASVNEKDNSNITALMYASMNGHLEVAKLLFECGANINEKSSVGYTPLIYSITNGHLEVLNFLLEKGANITRKDIDTPMAWHSYSDIAEHNYSPLYYVIYKGYLEILKVLMDKFGPLNLELRYNGGTVLVMAISYGHTKVAEFLIEKGARINGIHKHDSRELTAFSVASEKRNLEILNLLLEKGVNITSLDMNAIVDTMKRNAESFKIIKDKKLVKPLMDIVIYSKDQNGKSLLTYLSEKIINCRENLKKETYIEIGYMIIEKMADDYIQLFISLNKNVDTPQEAKDEINNHINMLYSLQKLPIELFVEIIKQF